MPRLKSNPTVKSQAAELRKQISAHVDELLALPMSHAEKLQWMMRIRVDLMDTYSNVCTSFRGDTSKANAVPDTGIAVDKPEGQLPQKR